jgi:hypothetical protein
VEGEDGRGCGDGGAGRGCEGAPDGGVGGGDCRESRTSGSRRRGCGGCDCV